MYQNKIKNTGKWHVALKILDVSATSRETMNNKSTDTTTKMKEMNVKKSMLFGYLNDESINIHIRVVFNINMQYSWFTRCVNLFFQPWAKEREQSLFIIIWLQ